ncbi:hypothetical protein S245_000015 [Arachis hypogaea]
MYRHTLTRSLLNTFGLVEQELMCAVNQEQFQGRLNILQSSLRLDFPNFLYCNKEFSLVFLSFSRIQKALTPPLGRLQKDAHYFLKYQLLCTLSTFGPEGDYWRT